MDLNGSRVLVTGADGFIGSHLAERLVREGASVRAFVMYNMTSSWGWLDGSDPTLLDSMEIVSGDVRDTEQVAEAVRGCDVVFHLAALISVPYSYKAPRSFVDTNVVGTLNVLEAARQHGGAKVIQTSSSEVYGTPEQTPIRESHPMQAQSPYAASKIAADVLAESYHRSYDLPVVVLRPFNTYGPRQSARAVLPTILTQILSGKSEIELGALWPRRDLTYVDDTVAGFLRAAEVDEAVGSTVQLGTGRDIAVGDLATLAIEVLESPAHVVSRDERLRPANSEVERLVSDPSLAGELLDWHPEFSLEEGLLLTSDWLRDRLEGYRVKEYVV